MKRDLQIPKVTFRVRTGDEVETDGGCAIGGQWINKTTDDFFKRFKEKVDWVFVDALYTYDNCLKDLKNSLNIVKKGGSIYGDDYGVKPGTTKAVDEFIAGTGYTLDNFYKDQFEIKI